VKDEVERERQRLLDPVDRISEILFGLIMAVTIVGSLSIATAGRNDVRTVLWGALGCNLAWGLVDAVMYLVRTATERTRNRAPGSEGRGVLHPRDFLEALAVFVAVVLATFPVVVPFIFIDDTARAMVVAQGITLSMLFLAGFALGRYAGYRHPFLTGFSMALFGALLIAIVKALGG
jgi:VIT1/CCC1 family predicted Fe2+/Mn2+ transporter